MFEIIVGFLIVLLVVMLVGHSLWLLLAWAFRGFKPRSQSHSYSQPPTKRTPPPLPHKQQPSPQLRELNITQAQINTLQREGLLDKITTEKLTGVIERKRNQLKNSTKIFPQQVDQAAKQPTPSIPTTQTVDQTSSSQTTPQKSPDTSKATPSPSLQTNQTGTSIPAQITKPTSPVTPSKPLSEILKAFMDQSNIRWGELVGGLLIVCCSAALVVSLWSHIEQVFWLKFGVFISVTAAIFGAGLYTHHKWKLPTTSNGLLIIGTLLVPLNYLAIAAFNNQAPATDPATWLGEAVATIIFAALIWFGARITSPGHSIFLTAGVIIASLGQLVTRRFIAGPTDLLMMYIMALMPLGAWLGTTLPVMIKMQFDNIWDTSRLNSLFSLLGTVGFASILGVGFLAYKLGPIGTSLETMAIIVGVTGLPAVVTGLMLGCFCTDKQLASYRMAGTTIAIVGIMMMAGGLVLAWPMPGNMLIMATIIAITCTIAALLYKMPPALLVSGAAFTLAGLIAFHLIADHFTWQSHNALQTARVLLSGWSGSALTGIAALLAIATVTLLQFKQKTHAKYLGLVTGVIVLFSLIIVTAHGFGKANDFGAVYIYSLYTLATLITGWLIHHQAINWIGSGLLLATLTQGLCFTFAETLQLTHPFVFALLTHTTTVIFLHVIAQRPSITWPMQWTGLATSIFSMCIVVVLWFDQYGNPLLMGHESDLAPEIFTTMLWPYMLWATGAWLVLSFIFNARILFTFTSAALMATVTSAITANIAIRPWFIDTPVPLYHPWTLQSFIIGMTLVLLLLLAMRQLLSRLIPLIADRNSPSVPPNTDNTPTIKTSVPIHLIHKATHLLNQPYLLFEGLVAALLTIIAGILALYGVAPGILEELAPTAVASDAGNISLQLLTRSFAGYLTWAMLITVWAWQAWQRFDIGRIIGLTVALPIVLVYIAGTWIGYGAAASALRWLLAGYWLLISLTPLVAFQQFKHQQIAHRITGLLVTLLPIIALTLVPVYNALDGQGTLGPAIDSLFYQLGPLLNLLTPLAILTIGMLIIALRQRLNRYAIATGVMINFTATLGYLIHLVIAERDPGSAIVLDLLLINALATALYSLGFLLIHQVKPIWIKPLPQRLGLWASWLMVVVVVISNLQHDAGLYLPTNTDALMLWIALAAVAMVMIASLFSRSSKDAPMGIWLVGLTITAAGLDAFDMTSRHLLWAFALALPSFALVAVIIEHTANRFFNKSVPETDTANTTAIAPETKTTIDIIDLIHWPHFELRLLNTLSVLIGTAISIWVIFTFNEALFTHALVMRLAVSGTIFIGVLVFVTDALFVPSDQTNPTAQQFYTTGALALLACDAVLIGWACIEPGLSSSPIHRAILAIVSLVAVVGLYTFGIAKRPHFLDGWANAATRITPVSAGLAVVAMLTALAFEITQFFQHDQIAIANWAIAVMIIAMSTACVILMLLAINTGLDPLDLSERGRMGYVYASEAVAFGLFVHMRVTMPWLFTGFFQQYWPLIVMSIAFVGVGLSEIFTRQKRMVLAKPLQTTGALLPLLPVIAFWVGSRSWAASNVDYTWQLLLIGILYGGLSIARKSYGFGMLAALAMNGGLWYFLHRTENFGLLNHPQLWLIPLALAALGASYLNRQTLNESQMTATRYICMILVYVSSTVDMFINGVADSIWLPMILMVLSVAGILVGIMLRIRSFMFLGSGFLLLSLIAMIWSASAQLEITWLWYIAGIILGALIITLFALFEKKRTEMLNFVDQLKQWEG